MASKIKVIGVYRPRIELGQTVQKKELMRAVSRATGLVEGSADQAIKEFRDQIIEFLRRSVSIEAGANPCSLMVE